MSPTTASITLNERDMEILQTLTFKVRVLSHIQIAEAWWRPSASAKDVAARRLNRLIDAGYLDRYSVRADAMLPLEAPVCAWTPGDPSPDVGAVAYRLCSRWPRDEAPRLTSVYLATQKTANWLGQRASFAGGLKHAGQVTHDLHVSALYLRLLKHYPLLANAWVGEAGRALNLELYEKLPDAILQDDQGMARLAIEFGGKYERDRVDAFYQHCAALPLAFELW